MQKFLLLPLITMSVTTFILCCRALNSLTSSYVLRGSFRLEAMLSLKYLRLSYLTEMLTSFPAFFKSSQQEQSFVRSTLFFRKSLLRTFSWPISKELLVPNPFGFQGRVSIHARKKPIFPKLPHIVGNGKSLGSRVEVDKMGRKNGNLGI